MKSIGTNFQSNLNDLNFLMLNGSLRERHGAMTGSLKSQIDWILLSVGAVRPTQAKTLAVMEVCGGSLQCAQRVC